MEDSTLEKLEPIHIVTVGAFGEEVATALRELLPDVLQTCADEQGRAFPASWPLARVHILAAWRPTPQLTALLDHVSFAWKRPFLTAVLEAPQLRVGPVIVPGQSACHGCYEKRVLQHTPRQETYRAAAAYYQSHPLNGPQGYLSSLANIAAIRLAQYSKQIDEEAGKLWQMNILTRQTVSSRVIGVHDCPRCGLKRDEATRSYLDMQHELAEILPWLVAPNKQSKQIVSEGTANYASSVHGQGGTSWQSKN